MAEVCRQGGREQVKHWDLRAPGSLDPRPCLSFPPPPTDFGVKLGSQIFIKHITDWAWLPRTVGFRKETIPSR